MQLPRAKPEEKWVNALLHPEGEARVCNDALPKTEAESRGFNESLPHFRVIKLNYTTTKCLTNVKHKKTFPTVGNKFITHVINWPRSCIMNNI